MGKAFFGAIIVGLLLVIGGIAAFLNSQERLSFSMFEGTPPLIKMEGPTGLGATTVEFSIGVEDSGSGLDEISVRLVQGPISKVIVRKQIEHREFSESLKVEVNARQESLKEGEAQLIVTAFDRSIWNNKVETPYPLIVDFERPRLEVVTVQNNGTVGGALLTFFRILSEDVVDSGVKMGSHSFPSYSAHLLDPAFEGVEGLRFSLYPIPADVSVGKDKLAVFATDRAGNTTTVEFYQQVRPRRFPQADMKMSRQFFVQREADLIPKFYREKDVSPPDFDPEQASDADVASHFPIVNEEYRAFLEGLIKSMSSRSTLRKLWSSVFDRPLAAKPTASFGEHRKYFLGDYNAGRSVHQGIDLADTAMAQVRAANDGIVIFADDFGIYGNAIVIDHGFGLISLYGHLSSFARRVGDQVLKGDEIGRTGATGLAGGDHLHFEMRLHGEPVSPFEWLDAKWIKDHIDTQTDLVRKQFVAAANSQ